MTPRRRSLLGLAVALVLALHALVLDRASEALRPLDLDAPAMAHIETQFTEVLAPSAAVSVAAAPPAARRRPAPPQAAAAPVVADAASAASAVDEAASAPAAAEAASAVAANEVAVATADAASAASDAASAAGRTGPASAAAPAADASARASASSATSTTATSPAAPAVASASAAASGAVSGVTGAPFHWPLSTRLSYQLRGWFRGEVLGQATVEWLRQGERYQVHLVVTIGPSFAPLVTRRMSSEGRIGDTGLVPQRYEQETQQIIGRTRRQQMRFEADGIELERGQRVPMPALVQDTASQFIQIIYLLRTRAELAEPGAAIEFPLALPNRVDAWVYESVGQERIDTPFGAIDTLHVKPRRRAEGNNLTVQMWYAPTLQMLPVRIRIEQDAQTWADLRLERAPEQAAGER